MNPTVLTILASLAVAASIFIGIMAEVLCLAGSPNSSPQQLHTIKMIMLAILIGTILCSAAAIVLMVRHHPGVAAVIGGAPAVILVVVFIWAIAKPS